MPLGTYTNDPPDQTALFRAANFVITGRHSFAEMFAKYIRVLAQTFFDAQEDYALLLQLFLGCCG